MKKLIAILILTVSLAGAINWEYSNELALDLRVKTELFLTLYEAACTGTFTFNGYTYDLPPEALTQVKADCVAAYQAMEAAQDAIKAWATE